MKQACLVLSMLTMAATLYGCANVESAAPPVQTVGESSDSTASSAETFAVEFVTTKGNFTVVVHPEWAPIGAQHFRDLVEDRFYDNCAFFRVMDGFMAQFGLSGEPAKNKKWEDSIMDDPVRMSNRRGYMTYAKTGLPNSRSTQLFINFGDNRQLDADGFAPFGKVDGAGMKVVDAINSEYGNPRDPLFQKKLTEQGQSVLDEVMPNVDYIKTARIVGEDTSDIPAEGF